MELEGTVEAGAEWDAFVRDQPDCTLAHAAAWAPVMRDAYRVDPYYLMARSGGGQLRGVLPLVALRTLRGRRELVSMPFLDTGGILAPEAEAQRALLQEARSLLARKRGHALELRQAAPLAGLPPGPPVARVGLELALAPGEEAQWRALPAKVRNQTRKAQREGLSTEGPGDPCDAFYEVFRVNMRDLGSPVHGRAFYRAAAKHFGDSLRFVVAWDGARPVAGLVAIHFGERVTVPWASSLRSERSRCPNNLIYWEALRWAVARGARCFDFGRSPRDSGTHRFKRGWGAEERELHWLRFDASGAPEAAASVGDHGLLRRLGGVWSRLPLGLTSQLGPRLRRHIPS